MSKVIHESKPAWYVVEYRRDYYDRDEWDKWESFHSREDAIKESDEQAQDNPSSDYRVIDTKED